MCYILPYWNYYIWYCVDEGLSELFTVPICCYHNVYDIETRFSIGVLFRTIIIQWDYEVFWYTGVFIDLASRQAVIKFF